MRGRTLDEAASATREERGAWAETMWRYVFRGTLIGHMFNADPHPATASCKREVGIAFLDHGCVQPVLVDNHAKAPRLHRAALDRDEDRFRSPVIALLGTRRGSHEERATAYTRRCFAPLFDSPFRISAPRRGARARDVERSSGRVQEEESNAVALPPGMVFMNRLQFASAPYRAPRRDGGPRASRYFSIGGKGNPSS